MSALRAAHVVARCMVAFGAALMLGGATPPTPQRDGGCPCPAKPVLPVSLYAMEASGGWALNFLTPPCPPLAEIRVAIDRGKPISLGPADEKDPLTHQPAAQHLLIVEPEKLAVGKVGPDHDHKLAIQLVRPDGHVDGPYSLLFSPRQERIAMLKRAIDQHPRHWVSFAEHGSLYTWLGFGWLFDARDSLREIRYSVNGCALDHRITFPSKGDEPSADFRPLPDDLTFDRPFLSLVREETSSVCVQLTFADGTVSETLEVKRDPKAKPH